MSPEAWERLAFQFAKEYRRKGITLKKFCDKAGINYGTAKKYISVKKVAEANPKERHPEAAKKLMKKTPRKVKKKSLTRNPSKSALKGAYIADDFGLTEKEFKFAHLISEGMCKYKAYEAAGYASTTLNALYANSSKAARRPKVARAIHYLKERRQERYEFERDAVITQMMSILRADPNELAQYRRINCRNCYGINHKYQWRDLEEQTRATQQAARNKLPPPDLSGGLGYSDTLDPHPNCPKCSGQGVGRLHLNDTRDLSGDARNLLEGVRATKAGVELITASKSETRRDLLRLVDGIRMSGGTASDEELLELRKLIAQAELRKKIAEAEKIERENEMLKKGSKSGAEATFVINLVNSPDMDDEEDSEAENGE